MKAINRDLSVSLTKMPKAHAGYEAFHTRSNKNEAWELLCHDFYEFYIHIGGGKAFCVGNDLYMLEPNQLFIIPPFCMHGLSGAGQLLDYERAYVNISPETLQLLGCEQLDLDRFFHSYVSRGQNRFQLSQEEANQLIQWIRHLQDAQNTESRLEKFQNYSILMSFVSTVCHIVSHSEALADPVVSNMTIQHVLTYLNSHYTQPIKITDLARQFNVSASFLSHEFSKYTNRSIYDYILYRRVMLAKEKIHTAASLNSLAYQCGFNDYSNFLRMFQKYVGMSPREYRAQHPHR